MGRVRKSRRPCLVVERSLWIGWTPTLTSVKEECPNDEHPTAKALVDELCEPLFAVQLREPRHRAPDTPTSAAAPKSGGTELRPWLSENRSGSGSAWPLLEAPHRSHRSAVAIKRQSYAWLGSATTLEKVQASGVSAMSVHAPLVACCLTRTHAIRPTHAISHRQSTHEECGRRNAVLGDGAIDKRRWRGGSKHSRNVKQVHARAQKIENKCLAERGAWEAAFSQAFKQSAGIGVPLGF